MPLISVSFTRGDVCQLLGVGNFAELAPAGVHDGHAQTRLSEQEL